MKKSKVKIGQYALLTIIVLTFQSPSFSESSLQCNDILKYAVKDELESLHGAENYEKYHRKNCGSEGSTSSFGGEAGYDGFSLGVKSDSSYKKIFCDQTDSESDFKKLSSLIVSSVNSEALEQWKQCKYMESKGVKYQVKTSIDSMTVDVWSTRGNWEATGFFISPQDQKNNIKCSGELSKATKEKPVRIGSNAQQISCFTTTIQRNTEGDPIKSTPFDLLIYTDQESFQVKHRGLLKKIRSSEFNEINSKLSNLETLLANNQKETAKLKEQLGPINEWPHAINCSPAWDTLFVL